MGSLLIKNGKVVTATETLLADIYIEAEKIQQIGVNLAMPADHTIDASDCYVFPGGVDPHTHMDFPFMGTFSSDNFETGTLAGLHGGTTTIIDFAIQQPGRSLQTAFDQWQQKAQGNAVSDFAFHVAVTDFNEKTKPEIKTLVEQHGVTSFKTFMAYKNALMVDDQQITALFHELKKHGAMLTTHAENGDLIEELITENLAAGNTAPKYHALSHPVIAEAEASQRIINLAHQTESPLYIVHMTCEAALNRVRAAAKRQQKVFVETCMQYLLLDVALYDEDFAGAQWVLSPPLREATDRKALWQGLQQNIIQTVATDHCPFCLEQKAMGKNNFAKIPNGIPGIEHRLELLFSEGVAQGRIDINKFVDLVATAPAKIFGLFPKKGTIAVGSDADLVIFDPTVQHIISAKTHHMNCDYSAYEGWHVIGKCRTTILRGTIAVDNGHAFIQKGFGKYLPREPFSYKNFGEK